MGGKGRKRREKNYRAAHGEKNRRLPPPPVSSSLDALPSKLRQILKFTHPHPQPPQPKPAVEEKVQDPHQDVFKGLEASGNDVIDEVGILESANEKKKKKRKRKGAKDLRFEMEALAGISTKRKERKKKRLEEMKHKRKKVKASENLDFPGREEIKFGEVVKAPPKLVTIPKGKKSPQDAFKERLRLEAVDGYRNRRGWSSRPGIHLPTPEVASM
ncbi:H/ACA ribonucleoprotein complex [Heracleum sosnowskyi]|uniref:H/ACA ribonucleoprotein complex n=1 Tax=Heracleum sosnowskyi TaxID=360622 RepID=A0AAD8MK33_9APIA|nr:H/ACA ribonucleoprotein complex [Heracleum sosnowskyi]